MTSRKEFGDLGEDAAAELVLSRGYEILERNFRYGKLGEIDLICKKDSLILFVEVKSRSKDHMGGALYSITDSKKRKMQKVARFFLSENSELNNKSMMFRFDLIAIEDGEMNWVEDIIR